MVDKIAGSDFERRRPRRGVEGTTAWMQEAGHQKQALYAMQGALAEDARSQAAKKPRSER